MAAGSGLDAHDLPIHVVAPRLARVRVNGSCHRHINYSGLKLTHLIWNIRVVSDGEVSMLRYILSN